MGLTACCGSVNISQTFWLFWQSVQTESFSFAKSQKVMPAGGVCRHIFILIILTLASFTRVRVSVSFSVCTDRAEVHVPIVTHSSHLVELPSVCKSAILTLLVNQFALYLSPNVNRPHCGNGLCAFLLFGHKVFCNGWTNGFKSILQNKEVHKIFKISKALL